jgi:hypothetical protein
MGRTAVSRRATSSFGRAPSNGNIHGLSPRFDLGLLCIEVFVARVASLCDPIDPLKKTAVKEEIQPPMSEEEAQEPWPWESLAQP